LKKQAHDRKQASLVQLKSLKLIPAEAKKAIDAFIQQDPEEGLAVSAPEANAYEFQSGGVIEMLEKLLDKFIAERTALEKEEMNSKHAYDMLMQDLKAQIAQATSDRDEKAEFKAETLQSKADAQGDLEDTTSTRDADQKYLDDLTATCEQKGADFESRQQLRAEEIEAIEKAIEIISSGAVSGNADKHLPGLLQTSAFAQLRAQSSTANQARVAAYLQKQGEALGSRVRHAREGIAVADHSSATVQCLDNRCDTLPTICREKLVDSFILQLNLSPQVHVDKYSHRCVAIWEAHPLHRPDLLKFFSKQFALR